MVSGVGSPSVPLEPLFESGDASPGKIQRISALPFSHALIRWTMHPTDDNIEHCAAHSLDVYRDMLRHVGIALPVGEKELVTQPYNLLVTRHWMLLVPRLHECFESISFNALAFAGALLLPSVESLPALRRVGPFAALTYVASRSQ